MTSTTITLTETTRNLQGCQIKTSIDTLKENADILVEYCNGGSFTIEVKQDIVIKGYGVKDQYSNSRFEVSTSKLNQLRKVYKVENNF
jgi:hypothetical protein